MDAQDRSILDLSPEVHVDVRLEDIATDKASQDISKQTLYEDYPRITNPSKARDKPTPKVNEMYRSFLKAALKGDWKDVMKILEKDPKAMTAAVITVDGVHATVLHVAIIAADDQLVENLIERWPKENEKKDDLSSLLETAVTRGSKRMVKAFMDKFHYEPTEVSDALCKATTHAPAQKEVILYLAKHLAKLTEYIPRYSNAMSALIKAGHFDICLHLAKRFHLPESAKESLLTDLVSTESYHNRHSGAILNFWEKYIYKCFPLCLVATSIDSKETKMARVVEHFKKSLWNLATKSGTVKKIGQSKLRHKYSLEFAKLVLPEMRNYEIVRGAASHGIFDIVKLCFEHHPELTWDEDFTKELMTKAVKRRNVELFNLLNTQKMTFLTDEESKQDMMEELIEWKPENVPADIIGAAFRMQNELQWFEVLQERSYGSIRSQRVKEEEDKSDLKEEKDKSDSSSPRPAKTRWEEKRQLLLKDAETWMKETSSSCSIVATLIITITFSAAFAVPEGNDGSKGIPIFLKKGLSMAFTIADALALFSSVAATLMFLAILTSRWAIDDFRHSLPRKMTYGLTFLFLSLAFMLMAFGSALVIVLGKRSKSIYIPISLLAAFPVVLFAMLHLPLYVEMIRSNRPRLSLPLKLRK